MGDKHWQFKKGQTGNPAGRPRRLILLNQFGDEERKAAPIDRPDQQQTLLPLLPKALQVLAMALDSDEERMKAVSLIFDRVWGKPKQSIEQTGGASGQMTVLHMLAARGISEDLASRPLEVKQADVNATVTEVTDLNEPAVE